MSENFWPPLYINKIRVKILDDNLKPIEALEGEILVLLHFIRRNGEPVPRLLQTPSEWKDKSNRRLAFQPYNL